MSKEQFDLKAAQRKVDALVEAKEREEAAAKAVKTDRAREHFAATLIRANSDLRELRGLSSQVKRGTELVEDMRDCGFRRSECENLLRDLAAYHGKITALEKLIERINQTNDNDDERSWRRIDEYAGGCLANLGSMKHVIYRVIELAEKLPSAPVSQRVQDLEEVRLHEQNGEELE